VNKKQKAAVVEKAKATEATKADGEETKLQCTTADQGTHDTENAQPQLGLNKALDESREIQEAQNATPAEHVVLGLENRCPPAECWVCRAIQIQL